MTSRSWTFGFHSIGHDGRAVDAYSDENQFIADRVAEAESVSARKATLLNPTSAAEYPLVLRRRLFEAIDDAGLESAVSAYQELWRSHADGLDPRAVRPETVERFRASYPFHPEVLDTLTEKVFTLSSFQRVRGMLRLLGRTVSNLWSTRPGDAHAIHLHHIDPGVDGIRQEIVTRLGQSAFSPAIANDIAGPAGNPALAERIDAEKHAGLPPYASYVARTAPTHYIESANSPWLEVDVRSTRQLRRCLDSAGAKNVPIFYSLAVSYEVFRTVEERQAILDQLKGVPIDSLWIKVSQSGALTHAAVRHLVKGAVDLHSLGVPLVGDMMGGLRGISALAFGALGGICHGVTQ